MICFLARDCELTYFSPDAVHVRSVRELSTQLNQTPPPGARMTAWRYLKLPVWY